MPKQPADAANVTRLVTYDSRMDDAPLRTFTTLKEARDYAKFLVKWYVVVEHHREVKRAHAVAGWDVCDPVCISIWSFEDGVVVHREVFDIDYPQGDE